MNHVVTPAQMSALYLLFIAWIPGRFRFVWKHDGWHWNTLKVVGREYAVGLVRQNYRDRTIYFPASYKRPAGAFRRLTEECLADVEAIAECSLEDVLAVVQRFETKG